MWRIMLISIIALSQLFSVNNNNNFITIRLQHQVESLSLNIIQLYFNQTSSHLILIDLVLTSRLKLSRSLSSFTSFKSYFWSYLSTYFQIHVAIICINVCDAIVQPLNQKNIEIRAVFIKNETLPCFGVDQDAQ